VYVPVYSFEDFLDDVEWRVRLLNAHTHAPDFVWPGVLILDVAGGLRAEAFTVGSPRQRDALIAELVDTLREANPRRFCWLMPCHRNDRERGECLLAVFGEPGRIEAAVADIVREDGVRPRLGPFRYGPFGSGARRASGPFVEPLVGALEEGRRRLR
jgi:hypothetical protein